MAGHQAAGPAGGSPQHTRNRPAGRRTTAAPAVGDAQLDALKRLRAPFTDDEISRRPILWCSECIKAEPRACRRHERRPCQECGENVSDAHSHLRYVGHAAATARLLDVDPRWNWEPLVTDDQGEPRLDRFGGLWLRLTVCGMSRLGYGDADGKPLGTRAVKEIIGNGIRNAGMRFGMALDLWSGSRIRPVEAPEPTAEEQVLARVRTAWKSLRGLKAVRQEAAAAGVLDFVLEGTGWVTIAELIDDRIDRLLAPDTGQDASAPGGHAEQPAPGADLQARQDDLEAINTRANAAWFDPDALQECLQDARARGRQLERVPGPDRRPYELGVLLQERIDWLRGRPHTEQGQEAA